MPLSLRGYAAQSATTPVTPFTLERRDPRPSDVVIDILYCGVCHSDIHQARNEWGNSIYPMVPGHEIIGRVASVGSDVSNFQVGEMVGVGCLVDSCQHCSACKQGLEQYCEEYPTATYNGIDRRDGRPTYGGYSERIVVDDKFVVHIPYTLDPKAAAPLLCAGITSYSPLKHWNVGPGMKVAVIGLGGLGHMGLKFAKAMGADVTLFTRSTGKQEEAKRLGADHVVLSTDEEQMKAVTNTFDFVLNTVPTKHDLNPYLATMKIDSTMVLVGTLEPLDPPVQAVGLIMGRKRLTGSAIGGLAETQEMIDFCAANNVTCDVEMVNIQDINEAYERVIKSDVKYRFVIDMASLKAA